jgi:hypothetical protein
MDLPPRIIDVPGAPAPPGGAPRAEPIPLVPVAQPAGPPIHPLSAVLLVVVDNLWNLAEFAVIDWIVTIPLSFISVSVPVYFLQRFLRHDSRGRALAMAFLLGVLAAVPLSITGTPAGLAILAWAGAAKVFGRRLPGAPGS